MVIEMILVEELGYGNVLDIRGMPLFFGGASMPPLLQ
jgi:hypothetical protein